MGIGSREISQLWALCRGWLGFPLSKEKMGHSRTQMSTHLQPRHQGGTSGQQDRVLLDVLSSLHLPLQQERPAPCALCPAATVIAAPPDPQLDDKPHVGRGQAGFPAGSRCLGHGKASPSAMCPMGERMLEGWTQGGANEFL